MPLFASVSAVPPKPVVIGFLCGLAALVLYVATASRGVEWQDSGQHQYRILTGRLENPLGLALSHPLHYWLGRAVLAVAPGWPEPAHRLNLLSAISGSAGVGLLAGVVAAVTRNRAAAILAGGGLLLTHTYWQMSALTETYTLAAALMTLEWALLWRYVRTRRPLWLVAVFAANGLHVANHLLGLLTLAAYGVLALERIFRRRLSPAWLAAMGLVWMLAASPYLILVAAHGLRTGDWTATFHSALFGLGPSGQGFAGDVLNAKISWPLVRNTAMILGYNFPSLVLPVALWGLLRPTRGRRRLFRNVLLAQSALICVFVCRYSIKDQFTFFVPVCVLAAFWFGLGAARLLQRDSLGRPSRFWAIFLACNVLWPLAAYAVFPDLARHYKLLPKEPTPIPYRDAYRHFLQPWKCNDDSAARFARDALEQTGENGWLLGGPTAMYPTAAYAFTHGGPTGIRIYAGRIPLSDPRLPSLTVEELRAHLNAGGRALAAPSPQVETLWGEPFVLDKSGLFWRVRLRE